MIQKDHPSTPAVPVDSLSSTTVVEDARAACTDAEEAASTSSIDLFSGVATMDGETPTAENDDIPPAAEEATQQRPVHQIFERTPRVVAPSVIPELCDIPVEEMLNLGRHLAQQPNLALFRSAIEKAMNVKSVTDGARRMLSVDRSIRRHWGLHANEFHSIRDICKHLGLPSNKNRNSFIGAIFFHTAHVGLSVNVVTTNNGPNQYEVASFVPWMRKICAVFDILSTIPASHGEPQICEAICSRVVRRNRC